MSFVLWHRTPQALDQDVYWAALYETTDGEMGEFGEDGSFQDVIHALEVGTHTGHTHMTHT